MTENKLNPWTKDVALSNLCKWCASQERSHHDVRTKLIQRQVYGDDLEDIMATLISEGFLNEERYAKAYANGKYKINKWGRNKIILGLKQKKVSDYSIKKALKEIIDEDYDSNLKRIIEKKVPLIKSSNVYEFKKKMSSFLLQKGYKYLEFGHLLEEEAQRYDQ